LSTCMPCHHFALPLSAVETLLAPAASVCRPDSTLHPRALPSCRSACRPHHGRPRLLLQATITNSSPPPFLCELTDNRPLQPSPGPVPASTSTTTPRSTSAPTSTLAPSASLAPHQCSPMPTAIAVVSQAPVTTSPSNPPIDFPSAPGRMPARPSLAARLWLPLFWPWAKKAKWAKLVSRARPSTSVG
jgi:hypothetical protein